MTRKEQQSSLLNIKQAAQFLNVSEVSLRRWTSSGQLGCLRIGPKRERRFRREHLQAFLQQQQTETDPVTSTPLGKTHPRAANANAGHVLLEGIAIAHGSHLCSLYETDLGRVKLAVPFLNVGLNNGETCYLVASRVAKDHILKCLNEIHPNIENEISGGNLIVSDGADSASAMLEYFKNAFVLGTRSGGRSLRVVGDMAWALDKGISIDELTDFELRYNQFVAHNFPVVSLCQYDARRFSGVAILDALKCHEDTFNYPLRHFL